MIVEWIPEEIVEKMVEMVEIVEVMFEMLEMMTELMFEMMAMVEMIRDGGEYDKLVMFMIACERYWSWWRYW